MCLILETWRYVVCSPAVLHLELDIIHISVVFHPYDTSLIVMLVTRLSTWLHIHRSWHGMASHHKSAQVLGLLCLLRLRMQRKNSLEMYWGFSLASWDCDLISAEDSTVSNIKIDPCYSNHGMPTQSYSVTLQWSTLIIRHTQTQNSPPQILYSKPWDANNKDWN